MAGAVGKDAGRAAACDAAVAEGRAAAGAAGKKLVPCARGRWSAEQIRSSMLLYAVTDRAWLRGRELRDCVRDAIAGGATFVQLREKHAGHDEVLSLARELKAVCAEAGVPFVIDDDVELAAEVGADGVHVGQSDMACAAATGSPTGMNIHRNTYAMTPAPNARAAAANASRTSHTGAPRCRLTPRHTPTRTRPFRGRINGRLGAADGGWARRACHCVRRGACGCRYGLFGWIMVPLCASGEDDMGHNAPVQGTIRVSPDACGGRLLL